MADIGISATLEYEVGSTFAAVPGLKSLSLPALAINSIDSTNMGHTDYHKRYFAGTVDAGNIAFTCTFSSAVYTALFGLVRDVIDWRVSAPDSFSTTMTCEGFLTKLETSMETEGEVMISGEIKLSGVPTL